MLSTAIEYKYSICSGIYRLEGKAHIGYGISVTDIDSNGEIAKIEDISTSKEDIEKLVALCNSLQLSPLHIQDVIEDFLE